VPEPGAARAYSNPIPGAGSIMGSEMPVQSTPKYENTFSRAEIDAKGKVVRVEPNTSSGPPRLYGVDQAKMNGGTVGAGPISYGADQSAATLGKKVSTDPISYTNPI